MDSTYFKDKKCLVTGAASGIGKSVALLLAEQGAQLFLTDVQEEKLLEVVQIIEQKGGIVRKYAVFNIADFNLVKAFADEVHNTFGAMDILMNIAGIAIWGAVDKMQHDEWRKVIDINLMGPIHVIESFIPKMIERKSGGHVVNVASAAALFGLPWHGAYCASKYGLRGLSDVMRHDLKRYNIYTHLVCPGAVDTGLVQTLKISGVAVDTDNFQSLRNQFQQHAVSPDKAASAILKGVIQKKYLVFTSSDIQFGYWSQRKFTFFYTLAMQGINDYFQKIIRSI